MPESGLKPSEPPGWYLERCESLLHATESKFGDLRDVRYSYDLKTVTRDVVDEIGALNFDVLYSRSEGCAEQYDSPE